MDDFAKKQQFLALITHTLSEHPDWLNETLQAATHGMSSALRKANERAAQKDRGLIAAMALVNEGRVSQESKMLLNGIVAETISTNPSATSQLERDFVRKYRQILGEAAQSEESQRKPATREITSGKTPEFRDGRYWDERPESTFEPLPLTTTDGRVVLGAKIVNGYMHGGCAALALSLHDETAYRLVAVRCYGICDKNFFVTDHVAIRLPDGLFLDARGVLDDICLIDGMIGGSFVITEMGIIKHPQRALDLVPGAPEPASSASVCSLEPRNRPTPP